MIHLLTNSGLGLIPGHNRSGRGEQAVRRNRHETWNGFCDQWRDLLAQTALPSTVTHNEHRFRELLERGRIALADVQFSLEEQTPSEWSAMYQFTAIFFHEFESFDPESRFMAFRDEAERRGNKFPR